MLATFYREKEANYWFPVLAKHGFTNLGFSPDIVDHENAIDAVGSVRGEQKLFALRTRDEGRYRDPNTLARYKRQFTIRYKRPSGVPVEWQKLFEMDLALKPDYFCYGWTKRGTRTLQDYLMLDVRALRNLHQQGKLRRYEKNNRIQNKMNGEPSTLIWIPVPELFAEDANLIAYHSDNHPALT